MRELFFPCLAVLVMTPAAGAQEANQRGLGYPTVAAALDAIRSKQGVKISDQGGWTIIDDRATMSVWSFTPASHPAHPAVIRRTVVQKDGQIAIQMNALCEASKAPCDKLVAEFQEMTDRMSQSLRSRRNP